MTRAGQAVARLAMRRAARHAARGAALPGLLALALAVPAAGQSPSQGGGPDAAARLNDYPTAARADYVFGCMATNGETREMLEKCACSIDEIASILPYKAYVEAETVLSMRRVGGERMSIFKAATFAEDLVARLRRAQAEAEMVCF